LTKTRLFVTIFYEWVPNFIFFSKNFDFIKLLWPRLGCSWQFFYEWVPNFIFFSKNFDFIKLLQLRPSCSWQFFYEWVPNFIFFSKNFDFIKLFKQKISFQLITKTHRIAWFEFPTTFSQNTQSVTAPMFLEKIGL